MKKIWQYLIQQIRADFHTAQYSIIALFLFVCIAINYKVQFEDDFLEQLYGFKKFWAYFLFYSIPYFFSVATYAFFKSSSVFRSQEFLIKSFFILLVLALDSSVPFLFDVVDVVFPAEVQVWGYKFTVNALSLIIVTIPVLLFYFVYERNENHVYGLTKEKFDTKPYFLMLLVMFPILIITSFHTSFIEQYPMYRVSDAHLHMGVPEWLTVAGYEMVYGLDFITVEFIFRGFMVIGMIRVLGRGAILPMAVVYCFLHFGKPAGEAISSIFGGYILGVIAYETKSIWGGIIVHVGIAWMMEIIGFMQKHL